MMKLRIYTVKNETQPVISNRSNIRATQHTLIEKKKEEDLHYCKESSYLQCNSYKS